MPLLDDLPRDQLSALARATHGRLVVVARDMLDAGLHVIVSVEPIGPRWSLRLLGLRGDVTIAHEVELPLCWAEIDEHTRLSILLIWIGEIRAAQERWWRRIALRQRALGLPIP